MKKNYLTSRNEINLNDLWKFLWDRKMSVIIITIIVSVMILGYDKSRPKQENSFQVSMIISPTKEEEFLGFLPLYSQLNGGRYYSQLNGGLYESEKSQIQLINNIDILDSFIEEFLDYEELITVLKNNEKVKKNISQLSQMMKQKKMFNYTKMFSIEKVDVDFHDYILTFTWGDAEEAKDILDQTLQLTLKSLKRSFFLKIDTYYSIKKNTAINDDLEKIKYLREQRSIAKALNLEKNNLDYIPNFNLKDSPYYFRGYKAIGEEINQIKDRKYKKFDNLKKEIDFLKNKNIKWIDYNIFHIDVALLKKKDNSMPWFVAILMGLLVGILYIITFNTHQYHKVSRKKKFN